MKASSTTRFAFAHTRADVVLREHVKVHGEFEREFLLAAFFVERSGESREECAQFAHCRTPLHFE